jgi:hypothetical protein
MSGFTRRTLVALAASTVVLPRPARAQQGPAILRGSNIRLRERPETAAPVLAILQGEMTVTLTGNVDESTGWRFIEATTAEGATGWIRWEFVVAADPEPTPAPAATQVPAPEAPAPADGGNKGRGKASNAGADDGPKTFTPEEQGYLDAIAPDLGALANAAGIFSTLASDPRLLDPDWTAQMEAVFTSWEIIQGNFAQLTPPPLFQPFHAKMLKALGMLDGARESFESGLDAMDATLIQQGTSRLELANTAAGRAADMLEDIKREYGE